MLSMDMVMDAGAALFERVLRDVQSADAAASSVTASVVGRTVNGEMTSTEQATNQGVFIFSSR